jgi:hypothetical protein
MPTSPLVATARVIHAQLGMTALPLVIRTAAAR